MRGSAVAADEQYVFVSGPPYQSGAGVLTDERTGRRTSLSRPGCGPAGLGGRWLVFACDTTSITTFELYDLSSGGWRAFAPSPVLGSSVVGVGTDWIGVSQSCDGHGCPVFEFANVQTGQVSRDPRNTTTTVNLNSPALAQRVCSPLTVPYSRVDAEGWGSLTFEGKFAVAAGSGGVYLEACGTRLHEFLTYTTNLASCPLQACAPPANSHVIIWQSAARRLGGIFLPSRHRFSIPVPAGVEPGTTPGSFANGDGVTIALTASNLYLLNQHGQIWTTPTPSAPSSR